MPILESVDNNEALSQGDVLRGVRLFFTGLPSTDAGTENEMLAREAPARGCDQLALVVSRPCNAIRDRLVIVARVDIFQNEPPKTVNQFDKALYFLESLRDGTESKDCIYLGQLPSIDGRRYRAKLNELYTIELPKVGPDRDQFLSKHRIARLNSEFCRDLHVRLFRSFASLGFDDHKWLSDADLQWLIDVGNQEIGTLELESKSEVSRAAAAGRDHGKTATTSMQQVKQLQDKIEPYTVELKRRKNGGVDSHDGEPAPE